MEILNWLIEWFKSNCNADWEHGFGIIIQTLDNPGWAINIDLSETELEDKTFEPIESIVNENDWFFCKTDDKIFKGRGYPDKLIKILEIFKNWVVE